MSEFKFACPICEQRLAANDDDAGYQINCPACQAVIVVPSNPAGPAAAPASVPADGLKKETPPRRQRAAPTVFGWMVRGLVVLVLLLICIFSWWRLLLYHHVNTQFDRIRAAGYPVSGAELNAWRRPVPDPENGALVITQAFALIRTFPDNRSNEVVGTKVSRTNQWSAATRGLVAAYVQTNAPAFAKVREAFQLSQFRYPADFSFGPETDMHYVAQLKQMAIIAELAAALDAEEGHADEWTEPVELQLKLAGTLDGEPAVIPYLVRVAVIRMAVKSAERSLNRVSHGDEACRRLQASFTRAGGTNTLPLALIGERAVFIPVFRLSTKEFQAYSRDDQAASPPAGPVRFSGKPMPFVFLTGFFERDLNFYLQTMDKSISLAALPPPASLALTNYFQSASVVARKGLYPFSGMLLPSLSKVILKEAALQADVRLAATALAVERFRRAQGRLPGGLEELAPQFPDAVPADPFDGAPLRYRRLARGYVIYSIDADGRDDGGREPPERKESGDKTSYDQTFTVER